MEQDLVTLQVYNDMTLGTLRSMVQADTGIHPAAQHLYHNGRLITDDAKTLEQLQISDGEMLALHVRETRGSTGVQNTGQPAVQAPRPGDRRQGGEPHQQDPELIRLQILGDPNLRAVAERQYPREVLDDPNRFAQMFYERYDQERRERSDRDRNIAALNADPFDIEAQARIEEIIRQERVMENLQNAMEHNPEGEPCKSRQSVFPLTSPQYSAECICCTWMSR